MYVDISLSNTLKGHSKTVDCIAFSPNGKIVASGSRDQEIKLWDTSNGQLIHTIYGHIGEVYSVGFSADGKYFASCGLDGFVRIYDTTTWEILHYLGLESFTYSLAFSPNSKIFSCSGDDIIKLWDVTSGEEINTLHGHHDNINSIAFSKDGNFLISGGFDQTIIIWRVNTGQQLRKIQEKSEIDSLAFSSDGCTIASAGDSIIKLWDARTGRRICNLRADLGDFDGFHSVAFSPNAQIIAGACTDYSIKLWEVFSGEQIGSIEGHLDEVRSVAFSADGKMIASGSKDTTIKLWLIDY